MPNNFSLASALDNIVHGSSRPGGDDYAAFALARPLTPDVVHDWCDFMRARGIRRVVHVLPDTQSALYERPLDETYREAGFSVVTRVPWADFELPTLVALGSVLDAFDAALGAEEKVVFHCSAGIGRTGLALSAWLIHHHNLAAEDAIETVVRTADAQGAYRDPCEAGRDSVKRLLGRVQRGDHRLPR